MRIFSAIILLATSTFTFAASEQAGGNQAFSCMDKATFEINSECMSSKIESSLSFQQAQLAVTNNASHVADRAIATMTFDPQTFTIEVVAHKDALLAKTN